MLGVLWLAFGSLLRIFRNRRDLIFENFVLRQHEGQPRTTPFQHGQLLSQHEVFKDEILAVAEDSKE
jgi:hypothetical protein